LWSQGLVFFSFFLSHIATTMATFANQISNLSALTSALGTFSRILELTEDDDSFQEGKK
jgi:hypothetical protein